MRAIEFRAKDENGVWCYSDRDMCSFWYGIGDGQLNSETLGQFTGLLDKNGKKIFEGDIIHIGQSKIHGGWKHKVVFEEGAFFVRGFTVIDEDKIPIVMYLRDMNRRILNDSEIIGNIYENPELLEEK